MNRPQREIEHDDPLGDGPLGILTTMQRQALGAFLKALSLAVPLVVAGIYHREGVSPLLAIACLLALVIWLCLLLFQRHRPSLAAHIAIAMVLAVSVAGVVADGSVRSSAMMVMFAGVVAAGAFLPRRSTYVVAGFALVALAGLNAAESLGLLRTAQLRPGLAVWLAQTVVLISVMVSVFHGRQRTREAFISQEQALARAARVEAELRASEARVRVLFRNNPAACLVQSVEKNAITDVNDAFLELFGYERDELIGADVPELWARPQELQAFQAQLRTQRRVSDLQATGQRKDGTPFDARVYAEVVQHGDEHLVVTMALDVSAETASRQALVQSEARFSKAFNFSPLGMTITRLSDGRFMEVNPANERVLGYTRADLEGKTATEVGVWVSEADRRAFVQHLQVQGGRLEAFETRMRGKAGRVVPVRIWSETIDIDGQACALAFTLNVESDKHREALLLEMAQGVSGATGEVFFRSLVTHLARTLEADVVVAGELDTPETVQSVAAWCAGEIVPDVHYRFASTPSARTQATGEGFYFANQLQRDHPGDRFPIGEGHDTYLGMALRDEDGSPIGVLEVLWKNNRPLTPDVQAQMTIYASRCNAELLRLRRDREIRKLQDTLEQRVEARTAQLEYLNRELDSFAYTVSHDLKSPLRSIDGFAHLLRDQMAERLQEDDHHLLDRIDASVQRMNRLITDLLALARVSQGSLQRMEVNLSELAEDVIRQERHRDPTRTVQVKIAPRLMANCDARTAHIALENLLGNAWKYTRHQAAATIELAAAQRPPGQPAVFFVRDNGAGFEMARADRLFQPFNRLHGASEFEGSGIGLATVRRILERHGGHIRGEGKVGQGAVFEFSFGRGD